MEPRALAPQVAFLARDEKGGLGSRVQQRVHILARPVHIVHQDERAHLCQAGANLTARQAHGHVTLVEGHEQVVKEVVQSQVAGREVDDAVGERGVGQAVGQAAHQGGLAHAVASVQVGGGAARQALAQGVEFGLTVEEASCRAGQELHGAWAGAQTFFRALPRRGNVHHTPVHGANLQDVFTHCNLARDLAFN